MSQPDAEKLAYAIVDEALHSYPPAEAPATLLPAVMARIQAGPVVPRFRLTWFDYAISLFGASMAGLIFMLWRWLEWPPVDQLPVTIVTGVQTPGFLYVWIIILAGLMLIASAVIFAAGIFDERNFQPVIE